MFNWLVAWIAIFLTAQQSQGQSEGETIYFVSGINGINSTNPEFSNLLKLAENNPSNKWIIFLGDYSIDEESTLLQPLAKLDNTRFAFLPGYSEWGKNARNGYQTLLGINESIGDYFDEDQAYLFHNGCPGPLEIEINDDLLLVLINDYWLLNDFYSPKTEEGCPYTRKVDFLFALEEVLERNEDRKIILAAYNPIESDGPIGGRFRTRNHLLPFPIIGSAYVAYRKLLGNPDDLSSFKSRLMRKYLSRILAEKKNVVYVSANEKHLDYRKVEGIPQVIIGSMSEKSYSKAKNAEYNSTENGFASFRYSSGTLLLNFHQKGANTFEASVLSGKPRIKVEMEAKDYENTRVDAVADSSLLKNENKNYPLMGLNYRREWAAKIEDVPVFNWGKAYGGLEIVKKGGGMQTRSLRLETNEGKQYVLRSIKKYPENAVPPEIRGTIFAELVNDQISASHPYGAYAIPKLADAAEVYHTNPQLVYLNDDPRLGKYSYDFANGLYLYEERPAKDRRDVESFGRPEDIESTFDVIEKTRKSGKHQIDQQWVLKSRLFDMWIGDWDRHDDQWRWAEFELDEDHKLYRPIPRDRDQAFFNSDGLILSIASRKWGIPKFQGFKDEIRDINGLNNNARYFDRSFLTEPSREDWLRTADSLKHRLTDEVIEAGIRDLPPEIFEVHGKEIIEKLKKRRESLPGYAEDFYEFLSRNVDVPGTNKANLFEVERLENGNTKVTVFEVGKNSGKIKYKLYEREFEYGTTKEIRLYGLKGKDEFRINGEAKKGIKVRIIGGGGEDKIEDQSRLRSVGKKTIVYDKKKGSEITKGPETKDRRSNDDEVNQYDRYAFKYNKLMPYVFVNYNADDGVFLGGGPDLTTHGFRKEPFRCKHRLLANIAPKSANYAVFYRGIFTDVLGKWDLDFSTILATPSFSTFFYGFGNNTILSEDKLEEDNQYYRVRFDLESVRALLKTDSKNEKHSFELGPEYLRANIDEELNEDEDDDPRFILDYMNDTISMPNLAQDNRFLGAFARYTFDTRDDERISTRGMHFQTSLRYLNSKEGGYYTVQASQSLFLTLSQRFKTILALRAGGAALMGPENIPFFIAPSIGGLSYLRGHRRNRFTGEQTFYQNTELRIRLFTFQNEFIIGDFGMLLFHDIGRVWTQNATKLNTLAYTNEELSEFANSNTWHRGYGFGLWIAPFDMAVLSADYSFSTDTGNSFFVRLGFFY